MEVVTLQVRGQLPVLGEILEDTFWNLFLVVKELLDECNMGVQLLQGDQARVGFVIPVFETVKAKADALVGKLRQTDKQKMKAVAKKADKRLQFYRTTPW
eukprot:Sspe_Gene.87597::Locus_59115_Transcript_1_1_Confidence_1.000_Length_983::g.87597::m.87597